MSRRLWPVYSNVAYVLPLTEAYEVVDAAAREGRTDWATGLRAVLLLALMFCSTAHHACDYDGRDDCRRMREADHVMATAVAASLALLFLPLGAYPWWDVALQCAAVAGAVAAVLAVGVEGTASDRAEASVAAAVVGVGIVAVVVLCVVDRRWPAWSATFAAEARALVSCQRTAETGVVLLGTTALAAAAVLWYTPAYARSDFCHGWWHVSTAVVFVCYFWLLQRWRQRLSSGSAAPSGRSSL